MSFVYYCPFCDQKIQCENEDDGAEAPCPSCRRTIRVRRSVSQNGRNAFPGFANAAQVPPIAEAQKNGAPVQKKESASSYILPTYERPVLALIFMILAGLNIVGALLSLVFMIIVIVSERNIVGILSAAGGIVVSLVSALIFWGISEVFSYIGRISNNTDAIRRVLELQYSQKK